MNSENLDDLLIVIDLLQNRLKLMPSDAKSCSVSMTPHCLGQ